MPLFEFCWMWFFPWIKLSWHSCKSKNLGWINWFCQLLCDWLSSFNPKWFYYSYAWSCSLCEGRTLFCTGFISRKFCRFLLMFLSGFTSLSVFFFLYWSPSSSLCPVFYSIASWNYNVNRNNMSENSFIKVCLIQHDFEVERNSL